MNPKNARVIKLSFGNVYKLKCAALVKLLKKINSPS